MTTPMRATLTSLLDRYIPNDRLAVLANLLYDIVFIGWSVFIGLYAIEVLLPTFVTARLSLVKSALVLLILTGLLAWASQKLRPAHHTAVPQNTRWTRFLVFGLSLASIGIVTLAHYRFPWWSIPILVGSYGIIGWLFVRLIRNHD